MAEFHGGFSQGPKSKKYQLNVHITALSLHGENKIISFYISESKFSLSGGDECLMSALKCENKIYSKKEKLFTFERIPCSQFIWVLHRLHYMSTVDKTPTINYFNSKLKGELSFEYNINRWQFWQFVKFCIVGLQ